MIKVDRICGLSQGRRHEVLSNREMDELDSLMSPLRDYDVEKARTTLEYEDLGIFDGGKHEVQRDTFMERTLEVYREQLHDFFQRERTLCKSDAFEDVAGACNRDDVRLKSSQDLGICFAETDRQLVQSGLDSVDGTGLEISKLKIYP